MLLRTLGVPLGPEESPLHLEGGDIDIPDVLQPLEGAVVDLLGLVVIRTCGCEGGAHGDLVAVPVADIHALVDHLGQLRQGLVGEVLGLALPSGGVVGVGEVHACVYGGELPHPFGKGLGGLELGERLAHIGLHLVVLVVVLRDRDHVPVGTEAQDDPGRSAFGTDDVRSVLEGDPGVPSAYGACVNRSGIILLGLAHRCWVW